MAQPQPVGWLIDAVTTSDSIPIPSADSIVLSRSQTFNTALWGPLSAMTVTWNGGQPVFYDINFELLVGWGGIKDHASLLEKMRLFHAWGSHQMAADVPGSKVSVKFGTAPPRVVQLYLSGWVSANGWLQEVKTEAKPPWRLDQDTGGKLGTSCVFTGKFIFVPGIDPNALTISQNSNNTSMAYKDVKESFYKKVSS